jgi:drug/metabolite transporter (DMT)-like permease
MAFSKRVGGVFALFLSATIFAFVSLCVKLASRYYSGFFISASRFVIGIGLCAAVLLWRYRGVKIRKPAMVALRGIFGAASMIASYAAISYTGPGRAALLGNTYPLFVALFGALFFKEKLQTRTLISIGVCTLGALLVMRDGSGAALSGDLLALGSSVLAGLAVNCVRRASSAGENPFVLYLSPCIFGLPMIAVAPWPASSGGFIAILLLVFVGAGSFAAQAFMSIGYRSVPAGRGSVVFYWETALTVLLGFLFGGEHPTLRFGAGLVVILAGLWLNRDRAAKNRARIS